MISILSIRESILLCLDSRDSIVTELATDKSSPTPTLITWALFCLELGVYLIS